MEKTVHELKEKMKKEKIKERNINRQQLQNTKVRFPTHTTNVRRSTSIQASAVLMSSESLLNFTSV